MSHDISHIHLGIMFHQPEMFGYIGILPLTNHHGSEVGVTPLQFIQRHGCKWMHRDVLHQLMIAFSWFIMLMIGIIWIYGQVCRIM